MEKNTALFPIIATTVKKSSGLLVRGKHLLDVIAIVFYKAKLSQLEWDKLCFGESLVGAEGKKTRKGEKRVNQ